MTTEDFRQSLLDYISKEKEYIEADIETHQNLDDDQKIEDGFLVKDAKVISAWGINCYDLKAEINNTRFRPGDKAILTGKSRNTKVQIIENGLDVISIICKSSLTIGESYSLEVCETYLLDPLTTVLELCTAGAPGYSYLSQLAGNLPVCAQGMFPFSEGTALQYTGGLNEDQKDCSLGISHNPSIFCMQGPPGTGKTRTLAAAANMVSSQGQQILVVAFTHQAVNNALNQIRKINSNAPIIKVGDNTKVQQLDPSIDVYSSMHSYRDSLVSVTKSGTKKKCKSPKGLVIGMTFHAALINFGLQHPRCVFPTYLFLDEASQMPLSYAAALGTFGASSVCLFGDSRQMPPIFHSNLVSHDLSISILDYCSEKLTDVPIAVLHQTYRMNESITDFVSHNFYEPHGIKLISAESARDKTLCLDVSEVEDERIRNILGSEESIHTLDVSQNSNCQECNYEEALFAAQLASVAMQSGLSADDIAIITPFRRQVNAIRNALSNLGWKSGKQPLVDTVERLQGQDVELIIISFATSDIEYLKIMDGFIFNHNRLNVMISRAKSKVVLLASDAIKQGLKWNGLHIPSCS